MDEDELQEYRSFAESVHDELTSERKSSSGCKRGGVRAHESVWEEVSLSACCAGGDHREEQLAWTCATGKDDMHESRNVVIF